jgi:hypothetical protein
MKLAILSLALCCLSSAPFAQPLAPTRTVSGNVVTSQADPSVQIQVEPKAVYVGTARFVLFGTADCEIHLFVDADASKRIRRVYWIQFEAYLPTHPTLRYTTLSSYTPLEMSGLPFFQRARFGQSTDVPRADSDAEKAYALLKQYGYAFPAETMNVTYKHFFADMRKELLLMVIEDMSLANTTFAQLEQDGAVQPAWTPIAEQLKERSSKVFSIRPLTRAAK